MIGMVVIAQMIAKDEALFLIDFLRRTVQATEA
jgi:hypothetical protein